MSISIFPKRILYFTIIVCAALVAFHILGQLSRFVYGHDHLRGLVPLFNLEVESNIPTMWSSLLAFTASAILLLIANLEKSKGTNTGYWFGLFAMFLFISVDEIVGFHEMTMVLSRNFFSASGIFYYAWIIPVAILVLVILIIYLKFLMTINASVRNLLVLAGTIYVGGAIGLEMFEGYINEIGGYMNLSYVILVTIEESMEMLGLCIFIYAFLKYIEITMPSITITIR